MLERFKEYILKENLFQPDDKILLGVSGGIDSVVMADLIYHAGFKFAIAHCNFRLRGKEADEDEKFVRKLAARYGVEYYLKRFTTNEYARENRLSIQMAARDLRYEWFAEILDQEEYDYIATAHHLDDQIETFFINLMRGTGITGMHGILPKSGRVVRPLLFATREDIEGYLVREYLDFREDKSNRSLVYLRNKIRHNLIPILEEMSSDYRKIFSRNFGHIREVERVYKNTIGNISNRLIVEDQNGNAHISIDSLINLNPLNTILYELLSPFRFTRDAVDNIILSLDDIPGKQFISSSHKLVKDRDYLVITSIEDQSIDEIVIENNCQLLNHPVFLRFSAEPCDEDFEIPSMPEMACFDLEKLKFPLRLRRWKRGDYFYPFGMKGKKKISDYFTDNKFSVIEKENTWLLISGHETAWIIGHRIDDRFRITPETRHVYRVELVK